MKKLLLLSALLIIGCSGDDNSEQKFLEKYDNVVFECQNCPINTDYTSSLYIGFTPSDNFLYHSSDLYNCSYLFEGSLNGLYDDWGVVAIINQTSNNLTYSKTYSNGAEKFSYSTNGTSLNLEIEWVEGKTASFIYLSTELTVNDICN